MAIARSSFEQYCAAVDKLASSAAAAVESEVLAWCSSNPGASTAAAREAAKAIMSGYMSVSNAAAASLAAEWYDETVGSSSPKIASAITEATYSDELVDKVARYQVRNYEDGDVAAFARNCGELASNDAKRALNDTIVGNAARDRTKGVRFARVCTGAETCAFCLMLSTRGAVYYTRQTAGEQNHYHRNCDCKIVAGVESDPYAEIVEGYNVLEIKARMARIEELSSCSFGDLSDYGELDDYLALYDADWLRYGDAVEVGYLDGALEKKTLNGSERRKHELELQTAEVLRGHGLRVTFQVDEVATLDAEGRHVVLGLPDLDTGVEIKTVYQATSENTISKHLASAAGKAGVKRTVIDVSRNPNLTDAEARVMISAGLKRHGLYSAFMLGHDGGIELVLSKRE